MEKKVTLRTTEDAGHRHERFFEEGAIQAGTYRTSEDGAGPHYHFFVVEEDVEPGRSATVRTSPPEGDGAPDDGHQHDLVVRAIEGGEAEVEDAKRRPIPREEKVSLSGRRLETKQSERNGVPVGVVAGYLSTWEQDTGGIYGVPDQFVRGAWRKSLEEHRARGNRQVRLKDLHGRTIGGFPIETVREDEVGLYGVGEINLETQQGREAFSLARQDVLEDFSVGYSAVDDKLEGGIRRIFEAVLWEASIVDEPANRAARILEVKDRRPPRALGIEEVRDLTPRDVERLLIGSGAFSKKAAVYLATRLAGGPSPAPGPACYDGDQIARILADVDGAKAMFRGRRDAATG